MDRISKKQRENELLAALKVTCQLSVDDAKKLLGISEATVRRLFVKLEQSGEIIRTYGGVKLADTGSDSYKYERLEASAVEEKKRIGKAAAALICSGDVIFLDTGTTVPHLCMALVKRLEDGEVTGLKVFTASLVNLNLLQKHTPVTLIGGEYRHNRRDFCGFLSEEALKLLNFKKSFLGADGLNGELGLTTSDSATARLNKTIIEHSDENYILVDSGKFSASTVITYSPVAAADMIITDAIPDDKRAVAEGAGVKVYVV